MATEMSVKNPYFVDEFEEFLADCSLIVEDALKTQTTKKQLWMFELRNLLQAYADITPAFKTVWVNFYSRIIENENELTDGFIDSISQSIAERN